MSEALWYGFLENAGQRLGKSSTSRGVRSEYQRDYDRIIFSEPFRRLQNKTQVWPLPKSEEVRNRLTHSLETASVGRSLGFIIGQHVLENNTSLLEKLHLRPDDFGYMVSAAALAHDIGNPPFGHQGEEAIQQFFLSPEAEKYISNLNDKQRADLQNFEGNAAGFRILAHSGQDSESIQGGLRLSLGTYGAFVKYPKESLPERKNEGKKSLEKFGIFQAELQIFEHIAALLHLPENHTSEGKAWQRHPLVFLTEAADDICYTIVDYEDGMNAGLISFEEYEDDLKRLISMNKEQQKTYARLQDEKDKAGYLRSLAINKLIHETSEIFKRNEDEILTGEYDKALTDDLDENLRKIWKNIAQKSKEQIYRSMTVLKTEATGKTVIPFLLEKFLDAVFEPKQNRQYYLLMPTKYRSGDNDYEKIMQTVMFVSGMSDRQAVQWYRYFMGIDLPGYD